MVKCLGTSLHLSFFLCVCHSFFVSKIPTRSHRNYYGTVTDCDPLSFTSKLQKKIYVYVANILINCILPGVSLLCRISDGARDGDFSVAFGEQTEPHRVKNYCPSGTEVQYRRNKGGTQITTQKTSFTSTQALTSPSIHTHVQTRKGNFLSPWLLTSQIYLVKLWFSSMVHNVIVHARVHTHKYACTHTQGEETALTYTIVVLWRFLA